MDRLQLQTLTLLLVTVQLVYSDIGVCQQSSINVNICRGYAGYLQVRPYSHLTASWHITNMTASRAL